MPEARRCPTCGADLPPDGQCVNCLLQLALPTEEMAASGNSQSEASKRIGPYKLLQQIGEGGMGSVWMAEQTEPVRRKVALKLIKPGMDSGQVLARFEAERQALALMDHPNVAKVLDAGTTTSGRPYFVMELVKGIPITKFCDEQKLSIRERLELFVPICQAIQHAHQKGIIHRDIKPSNVLVALYDGKPVPKVIDFGLAKAMGQPLTERTLFTGLWAVLGTLEYMSPEQAEVNQLDIDTRTDIYSLGVLLYQLLTGTTPLKHESLQQGALDAMLRRIREEEPPRPSTRLSESKEALPILSAQRKLEPAQLMKLLRGDLDWVVMKALEKDRNRRYETANGLAMDIQRHLGGQPVLAAAPTMVHRVRKFYSRHRRSIIQTGLGVMMATLVTAGVFLLWKAQPETFVVRVVSPDGLPIEGVLSTLVMCDHPRGTHGYPREREEETLEVRTDRKGRAIFQHPALTRMLQYRLILRSSEYVNRYQSLSRTEIVKGSFKISLHRLLRVTLRYSFNPSGGFALTGPETTFGKMTLYPMEEGSYRPPAQAHFSFKQNKIVGSSGVLDVGIEIDQQGGVLYFGGSRGRFDHCTDLGIAPFDSVVSVDTNRLVRKREDTPIRQGHIYIYESNIYPPAQRTQFTGFDVHYGKILVESIEPTDKAASK